MSILGVLLKKEFLQFKRNKFFPRLVVIFPVLIMLIMPWVTNMDIKHVSVAIADYDNSSLSRLIASKIKHSEHFSTTVLSKDYKEALYAFEQGVADIIIEIPEKYENSLAYGKNKKIRITANAVNAIKGSFGSQYLMSVIMAAHKSFLQDKGVNVPQEPQAVKYLYNPYLEYRNIMIPGFFVILIILLCGFLPAINIVSEKETGTIEQINVSPVSSFTFIMAKIIPYWIIGFFVLGLAMIISWLVYGLTPAGSLASIGVASLLFLLFISGFGIICANFSSTILQGMLIMFFFVMIFMMMSGLLTPVSSMPVWAQSISACLPPKYFIEIMRGIYLKGASIADMRQQYIALAVFAVLSGGTAALTYRKRMQ